MVKPGRLFSRIGIQHLIAQDTAPDLAQLIAWNVVDPRLRAKELIDQHRVHFRTPYVNHLHATFGDGEQADFLADPQIAIALTAD